MRKKVAITVNCGALGSVSHAVQTTLCASDLSYNSGALAAAGAVATRRTVTDASMPS